jgi:long-subunit acyl-CoA synthetase (AMP-forming)
MSAGMLFDALAARPAGEIVLRGDELAWDAPALLDAIAGLERQLRDVRVLAVLADNGPVWAAADLAALRTETVHLPLPGFFSPAQLAHALDAAGADALLTDRPASVWALGLGFEATGSWCGLALMRRAAPVVALPAGTAKVSFTSGSTGSPKGVCLSATGLLATARAVAARLADLPIERHLAVLPLALLLENVAGVYAPLLRGAAIHLPGLTTLGWQGMGGFGPSALHRVAEAARAHSMILVPELLKAWTLYLAAAGRRAPADGVYVAVGGARVDAELLRRARALGLPAYQGYGLTECGSVVSLNRPGDDGTDGDDVGRPLDHVGVRIEAGEVHVAAAAFLGYLGAPATGEFATGDLGELAASGHLHLSGRRKNLLVTGYGRNVAPEWIEAALLAEPAIAQAVVAGEGRPHLCALLVPAAGVGAASLAEAVARANRGLPDYARVGGWAAVPPFTPHDGLATGNGRPVRARILDHHAAALAALYQEEPADVVL